MSRPCLPESAPLLAASQKVKEDQGLVGSLKKRKARKVSTVHEYSRTSIKKTLWWCGVASALSNNHALPKMEPFKFECGSS